MRMRPTLALAPLAFALACAPISGPVDVEALVRDPDAPDGYRLATVTLETVTDLFAGRGERFDVRAGGGFYASPTLDGAALDGFSPEELWEASRTDSDEPRPDLTFDGSRWVARDFDGLHYLTVFHNLERGFTFLEDELGIPSEREGAHAHVGLYGAPVSSRGLPLPVVLGDNAAYAPSADMFLVVPVIHQSEGVPPFMDVGIATHELHHRVFFHRVLLHDDVFPLWKRLTFPQIYKQEELGEAGLDELGDLPSLLYTAEERRTLNQLRALDEGLADLFAVGHTQAPDFIAAFAPEHSFLRALDGEYASAATFEALEDGTLPVHLNQACLLSDAGDNLSVLGMSFYCLGTLVAAALFEAAGSDTGVLREEVLPAVEQALGDLGPLIAERSPEQGPLTFSLDMALERMAARLPPSLSEAFCARLEARFARLLADGGVPTCS